MEHDEQVHTQAHAQKSRRGGGVEYQHAPVLQTIDLKGKVGYCSSTEAVMNNKSASSSQPRLMPFMSHRHQISVNQENGRKDEAFWFGTNSSEEGSYVVFFLQAQDKSSQI